MPCYLVISESREFWRVDQDRQLAMDWTVERWDEFTPKDIPIEKILVLEEGKHLSILSKDGGIIGTDSPVFKIIELPRDREYANT